MADTDPLQPGELFELECVDDDGALFTVYLVAEVGAAFSDVWRAVPRLKKTIDRVVDVSRIAQISTLAEVRQLNAAHDDDH